MERGPRVDPVEQALEQVGVDSFGKVLYRRTGGQQVDIGKDVPVLVGQLLRVGHRIDRVHLKELEYRDVESELDSRPEVLPEDLPPDVREGVLLGVRQLL